MSSVAFIAEYPSLLSINVGLEAAIPLILPLMSEFDLMLTGSFGLGSLAADISLQLQAALNVQLQLGLQVSNPFASIQATLAALIQVQASLSASLSLGLPAVSITAGVQIAASAAIAATLAAKLGGLNLLIQAALAIKLPVVDVIAELQAALNLGPFDLVTVGYSPASPATLASAGADFAALAAGGVGTIAPGDQVWGVIILTKASSASASLSVILKTS